MLPSLSGVAQGTDREELRRVYGESEGIDDDMQLITFKHRIAIRDRPHEYTRWAIAVEGVIDLSSIEPNAEASIWIEAYHHDKYATKQMLLTGQDIRVRWDNVIATQEL